MFLAGLLTSLFLGIVVHELSHFTLAKLFNYKILNVQFGQLPTLLTFKTKTTIWQFGAVPLSGYVLWIPRRNPRFIQEFLIILAGPLSNMFMASVTYYQIQELTGASAVRSFLVGFCIVQCWLICLNLVPWKPKLEIGATTTDGYKLLRLLNAEIFRKDNQSVFELLDQILQPYTDSERKLRPEEEFTDQEWRSLFRLSTSIGGSKIEDLIRLSDQINASNNQSPVLLHLLDQAATAHVLSNNAYDPSDFKEIAQKLLDKIEQTGSRLSVIEQTRVALLVECGQHKLAYELADFSSFTTTSPLVDCLNNAYRARCELRCGDKAVAQEKSRRAVDLAQKVDNTAGLEHIILRMQEEFEQNK